MKCIILHNLSSYLLTRKLECKDCKNKEKELGVFMDDVLKRFVSLVSQSGLASVEVDVLASG